jgi:hypothetical protein
MQVARFLFRLGPVKLKDMNRKPVALVVFLENVGHIHGVPLRPWMMNAIDWLAEEYAKLLLRLYGAYRRYDQVIILEDEQATGPLLVGALTTASHTHQVDVLLLVHGHRGLPIVKIRRCLICAWSMG